MIKSTKTIDIEVTGSIKLGSFEASKGYDFTSNNHTAHFTANTNDRISNFVFEPSGHMEFDYHDKHYSFDVGNMVTVVLGDIAEFQA